MTDMPIMRAAFRTTVSGGGKYEMVFRFPSMDDMHAADDEWRGILATPARTDDAGRAMKRIEDGQPVASLPTIDRVAQAITDAIIAQENTIADMVLLPHGYIGSVSV